MADFNIYFDKLIKWEGGWADDPDDKGGKTNMGVTLNTWKAMGWDNDNDADIDDVDLRNASKDQIAAICKKNYWDFFKADNIHNQVVAQHCVDFGWGSGPVTAAKRVQRIIGVPDDGKVGPVTLLKINSQNPTELIVKMEKDRIAFLDAIIASDPSQKKFERGWKRRVQDILNKPYNHI